MLNSSVSSGTMDDDMLYKTPLVKNGVPCFKTKGLFNTVPMIQQPRSPETKEDEVINLTLPVEGLRSCGSVIHQIEVIFESIIDALNKNDKLTFTLRSRSGTIGRVLDPSSNIIEHMNVSQQRVIRFPAKTPQEAWRFTVIVHILEIIHNALVSGIVVTKRDIYYRHPALFVKQSVVDQYVDDLACTFNIPRSLLNVTAAAKGLVAGRFQIHRKDKGIIDGLSEREGMLIPTILETDAITLPLVSWILVVEKEATFRFLVGSVFWEALSQQGIIITGKGYPDILTREFLQVVGTPHHRNDYANPLIYTLTDYDPDGLSIHSVYAHGSYALAHQNKQLAVPHASWLGIKSSQIHCLQNPLPSFNKREKWDERMTSQEALLSMSARDRHKARKLLEREGMNPEWIRELQIMLMINQKAEIQIMESKDGGLFEWLKTKLWLQD